MLQLVPKMVKNGLPTVRKMLMEKITTMRRCKTDFPTL